jgi:hypothetical protein
VIPEYDYRAYVSQKIPAVQDQLMVEGLFAPGERLTLRHLAMAILAQPDVRAALSPAHLPSESVLRSELTGGALPSALDGDNGDTMTLSPLPNDGPLIDDREVSECLVFAGSFDDTAGLPSYLRLLECAITRGADVRQALSGMGVDVDGLLSLLRDVRG